jgi:hypothetical protein
MGLVSSLFAQKASLSLSRTELEMYEQQELVLQLKRPDTKLNPFKACSFQAEFVHDSGSKINAEGFCDSQEGTLYRLRFMPNRAGVYRYTATFSSKGSAQEFTGSFVVRASQRRGPLRIDPSNPWHFIYENTGEHYFWNSTTTYWLLGWKDQSIISATIDRLASYGINRIRVGINARAHGGDRWSEPTVVESPQFTFKLNPWVAARPDDLDDPGFDVSRLNVAHWQKLDRLITHAQSKGIIVSLIFYVDGLDHGCDPFKKTNMGNADEQLYYRYAAARYWAYPNIMWDIANEYHLFRTPEWAEKMGNYLKAQDPAQHLISVHGKADFPFRKSPWVDVVMYQSWDECGGYPFMSNCRKLQEESGRILPQINEEYGYEEHYPPWGCGATASKTAPDGRSAWNRCQLAWEICMTGSYQTTGERADYGTGAGEDSGGGWINGRGNAKMTMLNYYRTLRETFEKTTYWKLEPRNDLVSFGNLCLANVGQEYLIFTRVQHCRVNLPPDQHYTVSMINPRTGEVQQLKDADSNLDNRAWQYRHNLEGEWVFILRRK